MKSLNVKHEQYIEFRANGKRGAEAARLAGYSDKSARYLAHRLETEPLIVEAIAKRRAELRSEMELDTVAWLWEVALIARSDVRHFVYDPDTNTHTLAPGVPDSAWRAIREIYYDKKGRQLLRFWPKNDALALLGKNLDLTPEHHKHTLPAGIRIELVHPEPTHVPGDPPEIVMTHPVLPYPDRVVITPVSKNGDGH